AAVGEGVAPISPAPAEPEGPVRVLAGAAPQAHRGAAAIDGERPLRTVAIETGQSGGAVAGRPTERTGSAEVVGRHHAWAVTGCRREVLGRELLAVRGAARVAREWHRGGEEQREEKKGETTHGGSSSASSARRRRASTP